jgi:hypothetical protein
MDYVDRIERARFLGREFLVWLWHESEAREGVLPLSGGDACELWLEEQLTLVSAQANEKSESKLKSAIPSASPEAKEALRQGKLPVKAKVRVNRGTQSWGFLLDADTLGIASVQIPAMLKEENDDKFYERMDLVESLEAILDDLLGTFLTLRTSERWDAEVVPKMRSWVKA